MSGKNRSRPPIGLPNIHAFRMQRHHFLDRSSAALTQVSGDVCGIQAQVMAAAEMALWARMNGLARAEISAALWEKRTLVKTSLMRQTLHLIPAEDFSLFITALRRSRVEAVLRVMARFHIQREEAFAINEIVVAALRDTSLERFADPAGRGPYLLRSGSRAGGDLRAGGSLASETEGVRRERGEESPFEALPARIRSRPAYGLLQMEWDIREGSHAGVAIARG